MDMSERALLFDSLESLKSAATNYIQASTLCDSQELARLFKALAVDKCEGSHAIYNLMHQTGIITTESAGEEEVQGLVGDIDHMLKQMKGSAHPAPREISSSRFE